LGCGKDHTVNRCFAATFVPFFAKSWEHVHRLPVPLRIFRNARSRISITCCPKQVVDGRGSTNQRRTPSQQSLELALPTLTASGFVGFCGEEPLLHLCYDRTTIALTLINIAGLP